MHLHSIQKFFNPFFGLVSVASPETDTGKATDKPCTCHVADLAGVNVNAGTQGFRLHLNDLVRTEHVDELVVFLGREDLRLTELHLDLSGQIEPPALDRLLAAVEKHAETMQELSLKVDGGHLGPIPEALRRVIVGSKVCLGAGGPAVRKMLFGPCLERLGEAIQDLTPDTRKAPLYSERERAKQRISRLSELSDFLQGKASKDNFSIEAEGLGDVIKLLDDVALRAIAMLSRKGVLRVRCASVGELKACQALDSAKLPYCLNLTCKGASELDRLVHWLSSEHPTCLGLQWTTTLSTLQNLMNAFEISRWTWSKRLTSLKSMTVHVYESAGRVRQINGESAPAMLNGLCAIKLTEGTQGLDKVSIINLTTADKDHCESLADIVHSLQPRFLKLQANELSTVRMFLSRLGERKPLQTLNQLQIAWTDPVSQEEEADFYAGLTAFQKVFDRLGCVFIDPPSFS